MYKNHKTVLISFADSAFAQAQKLNSWAGKNFGKFDKIIEYHPDDIDDEFFAAHQTILSIKRGAGEWLWKPYFILKTLQELEEGDYLFYCDAGAFIIKSCRYLFDSMHNSDIWVSDIPLIEKEWSKPSMLEKMEVTDEATLNSNQIQATFLGVKKTKSSVEFIRLWLSRCCEPNLLLPDELGEKQPCLAHREDQSILSVLCKQRGIEAHRDPSQYGRIPEKYKREGAHFDIPYHEDDQYPVMFILHRTKNGDKKTIFRQWLNAVLPKKLVYRLIKSVDTRMV